MVVPKKDALPCSAHPWLHNQCCLRVPILGTRWPKDLGQEAQSWAQRGGGGGGGAELAELGFPWLWRLSRNGVQISYLALRHMRWWKLQSFCSYRLRNKAWNPAVQQRSAVVLGSLQFWARPKVAPPPPPSLELCPQGVKCRSGVLPLDPLAKQEKKHREEDRKQELAGLVLQAIHRCSHRCTLLGLSFLFHRWLGKMG